MKRDYIESIYGYVAQLIGCKHLKNTWRLRSTDRTGSNVRPLLVDTWTDLEFIVFQR